MNKYEGMFLLDHGKVKSEAQKGIDEITRIIEKCQGKVENIAKWDERRLAYEVNKQKRGSYVFCHFHLPGDQIAEFTREFNLNEIVSRHLVVRLEEFPEFLTAQELEAKYGSREYRDRGRRTSSSSSGRREGARREDGAEAGSEGEAPAKPAETVAEPAEVPAAPAADETPKTDTES